MATIKNPVCAPNFARSSECHRGCKSFIDRLFCGAWTQTIADGYRRHPGRLEAYRQPRLALLRDAGNKGVNPSKMIGSSLITCCRYTLSSSAPNKRA